MLSFMAQITIAFYLLKVNKKKDLHLPKKWIIAHRGASAITPENTLLSFKTAMQYNADGVEFDVCMSKDGAPVVIHDDTVARVTNGHGNVKDLTLDELQKLEFDNYPLEHIPTLSQALHTIKDHKIANVELKSTGNFSKQEFIDRVLPVLKTEQKRLKIIISSFDSDLLLMIKKQDPSFLIACLYSHYSNNFIKSVRLMPYIKPDLLHLPPRLINPLIISLANKKSVLLAVWTINTKKEAAHWLKNKVSGIFTDHIEVIK